MPSSKGPYAPPTHRNRGERIRETLQGIPSLVPETVSLFPLSDVIPINLYGVRWASIDAHPNIKASNKAALGISNIRPRSTAYGLGSALNAPNGVFGK